MVVELEHGCEKYNVAGFCHHIAAGIPVRGGKGDDVGESRSPNVDHAAVVAVPCRSDYRMASVCLHDARVAVAVIAGVAPEQIS